MQRMDSTYCTRLASADRVADSGGKAAGLAKAIHCGARVPPGFVIGHDGLRFFLERSGLSDRVTKWLETCIDMDRARQGQEYSSLCAAVHASPVPISLEEEVGALTDELLGESAVGLAVRSSGTQEDLVSASFAGIYESYLGVMNRDDALARIKDVWCSAWSPQAVRYTKTMGLDLRPAQMAVLVQSLVAAESAGVIFTADPLDGNPWTFILNAVPGLASQLVNGSAPADCWVLAWDTGEILERQIAVKVSALAAEPAGIRELPLAEEQGLAASLSDGAVRRIAGLALTLDQAFDRRVDIEWAFSGGELYILQVRPITALPPFFPHRLTDEESRWTWTPSTQRGTIREGERLVAPILRHCFESEMWDRHLEPGDIFHRREAHECDFNGYRYTTEWKWTASGHDLPSLERWLDQNEARLRAGWLAQLERAQRANRFADDQVVQAKTARDLLQAALWFEREEEELHAMVWYAPQWLIFSCEQLLKEFMNRWLPEVQVGELLQGLSCYSTARTIAAQDLGRGIQESFVRDLFAQVPMREVIPILLERHPGCRFLADYERFCWTFGLVPPSLAAESPSEVPDAGAGLVVIRSSLLGEAQDARKILAASARLRQDREAATLQIVQDQAPEQLPRWQKLLAWAQFWIPALDNRKWHSPMSLRVRPMFLKAGELLVLEGLLPSPADILLLPVEDLAQIAEGEDVRAFADLYQRRRCEYERNRRLTPPPFLGQAPASTPAPPVEAPPPPPKSSPQPAAAGKVFRGQGFAPGIVAGISLKVADLDDTGFMDGLTREHILVCAKDGLRQQWRRDWLSLFMVVKGLVTAQGAQLHHATQLSRECGVPYVNLSEDDYDLVPDHASILIDGREGTVTILE